MVYSKPNTEDCGSGARAQVTLSDLFLHGRSRTNLWSQGVKESYERGPLPFPLVGGSSVLTTGRWRLRLPVVKISVAVAP